MGGGGGGRRRARVRVRGRYRERAAYDWTAETTVYVDRASRSAGSAGRRCAPCWRSCASRGSTGRGRDHAAQPGFRGPALALGFERIGLFEEVGWKDGAWHGVEFFALELSPPDPTPAPIRPLPELAGSGELERVLADAAA